MIIHRVGRGEEVDIVNDLSRERKLGWCLKQGSEFGE